MTSTSTKSLAEKNLNRRAFIAAAGAAGTAALAGCAGGSGDGDAGQSATAPDDAAELTKLTFVLDFTPNTNHTGVYVAAQQGYYAEEGIELEIVQPGDGTAEAIIGTGQAQVGVSYQDYIANVLASDAPMPISAVAAIIQHNTSGIMSREEDGITHPAAMEGHTYATWNMPVELATVQRVVEADGGDFSKVTLVPYETDDDMAGLRANMFDTVWVYEGWAVQNAVVQGFAHNYFSFISADPVFDYYTPVIAMNDDWAAANPELARAFLRATKRGYEYCVENPSGAADILCAAVPELDAALVQQSQEFLAGEYVSDAESWGVIDPARWSAFYQWLNDSGLVENELDVNAGYTTDYLE